MTALASAWQTAISYLLTGALAQLLVTSCAPTDSSPHTLSANLSAVQSRSSGHHGYVTWGMFKNRNQLLLDCDYFLKADMKVKQKERNFSAWIYSWMKRENPKQHTQHVIEGYPVTLLVEVFFMAAQ